MSSSPSGRIVGAARKPSAADTRFRLSPGVLMLVGANTIPLIGVVFWGWDLFVLLTTYWCETGVIGFWALVRLALETRWAALFFVPFFCVHFGGFMAVHFVFLYVLFADPATREIGSVAEGVKRIVIDSGLWIALIAMFFSHGVGFLVNFLRPWLREGRPRDMSNNAMTAPYARVILMHITILAGAFLVELFHAKIAAFVLLIVLKTMADLGTYGGAAAFRRTTRTQPKAQQ
jgi:hypothetical protein